MNISDKNQPRLVLVVILLVFGSIMAYSLNAESKPKIDVEEGYDEVTVTVPPAPETKEFSDNDSHRATATSYINEDQGYLKLDVGPRSWHEGAGMYYTPLTINIDGNLSSQLSPEELVIEAEVINGPAIEGNHNDWSTSFWDAEGLELWPPERMNPSSVGEAKSFIGADVEDNNFSTSVRLGNEHPSNYSLVEEPITIEFRAILQGLEDEVKATARVSFTQKEVSRT